MSITPDARLAAVAGEVTTISASARVVLFCLIGVLLVILGCLIVFALVIRRRPPGLSPRPEEFVSGGGDGGDGRQPALAATGATGAAVAVVAGGRACPTCRRSYGGGLEFCPHDARRLVPAAAMAERARAGGGVCPRCRRAFDPGVRFCPHDAAALVPVSVFEITRGAAPSAATGVIAKICPNCRRRYDLAVTFCGRDGAELVVIN